MFILFFVVGPPAHDFDMFLFRVLLSLTLYAP